MVIRITTRLDERELQVLARAVAAKFERRNAQEGVLVPVAGSRTVYAYMNGEDEDVDGYNNVHAALRRMMWAIGRTFDYTY